MSPDEGELRVGAEARHADACADDVALPALPAGRADGDGADDGGFDEVAEPGAVASHRDVEAREAIDDLEILDVDRAGIGAGIDLGAEAPDAPLGEHDALAPADDGSVVHHESIPVRGGATGRLSFMQARA